MATQINIHQAKAHLSAILQRVQQGEEFILTKAGKPIARLAAVEPPSKRQSGLLKGAVPDSFFEPLPEEELRAWESQRIPD